MSERPDIIVIFPDQWRGDALSHLGHAVVETPHLSDLAMRGVTFRHAYTPCPSCIAARASLITGLCPSRTGRLGYQDNIPWVYADTLMHRLADRGYQTINVGKTHFHPQREDLGYEINELYDTQQKTPDFESDYHRWLREQSDGLIQDTAADMTSNSWFVAPWPHPEYLHPTNWTSTRALHYLAARDRDRPLFMTVNYHRPHAPLDPPLHWYQRFADVPLPPVAVGDWAGWADQPVTTLQAYVGRLPPRQLDRTRRAYFAVLAHIDYQIGRILFHLAKTGRLNETLIIFASDHGEMLGDHYHWRKYQAFEGSARIPLIIKPPTTSVAPCANLRISDAVVTLTDLMPTILDYAGAAVPADIDGRSLAPLVRGQSIPWRPFVHGEHAPEVQYVTDGREKFIWLSQQGIEYFFDLQTDPHELRNLASSPIHKDRVDLWRCRLIETLEPRHVDGLVKNGQLVRGAFTHAYREAPRR